MTVLKTLASGVAAAVLLCAAPALSAPLLTTIPRPVTGVKTEILALPALPNVEGAPPPGYGAEPLMAALYNPIAGENMYGPAIVFVDEGPGSHPAMATLASRFAAERLAAKGYTVVSIFSRIDRNFSNASFKNVGQDIKTAIDFLEARGHEDIVLAGHGLGATAVSLYMATYEDELYDSDGNKRVKAAVLFAPPTDDLLKEGGLEGARLTEKVAEAKAIIADTAPPKDPMDGRRQFAHADMVQSPAMFLKYWGPDAETKISAYLPKVTQPVLMVAGANDELTPPGRLDQLKSLAAKSAKAETILYPGVNHAFDGAQDKVTDDVAKWLDAQNLGIKPRVNVELLDARFEDGSVYPATLYTPAAGADPAKPAFLLQWGTSGDMWHSASQWLGWRLAQEGYVVLSPRTRMGGGIGLQRSTYKESTADLKAWMDVLEKRGITRVIAEGHSLGGVLVSNLAVADKRVVGLVYMAPTRDSPVRSRECQGDAHYAKVVAQAKAAVAAGKGRDVVPSYATYPGWCKDNVPPEQAMRLSGGGGDTAFHFLDFRGPNAPIHTRVIKNIKAPGIAFGANQDPLMAKQFLADFKAAYGGPLEVVRYDGTHGARESKTFIRDKIVEWTKQNFK